MYIHMFLYASHKVSLIGLSKFNYPRALSLLLYLGLSLIFVVSSAYDVSFSFMCALLEQAEALNVFVIKPEILHFVKQYNTV